MWTSEFQRSVWTKDCIQVTPPTVCLAVLNVTQAICTSISKCITIHSQSTGESGDSTEVFHQDWDIPGVVTMMGGAQLVLEDEEP